MTDRNWLTHAYLWACQRLYDECAWSYDAISWLVSLGRWSTWRRLALEYALLERQSPAGPLLEIGFGTGSLLADLACTPLQEKLGPVYGVEYSTAMQKRTTIKLNQAGLDVPRVVARSQELPFATNSFATIISTFPASYIFEQNTLAECERVLYRPSDRIRTNQSGADVDAGRLIIVGAWVAPRALWLRHLCLPFYGVPNEAQIEQIAERIHEAGLTSTFHMRDDGPVSVSVIVATNRQAR
ncbi:class I SAM-dependent methyltransferase [Chloroflexi bacterium TSY]|nr:class I SAM-dependent methyltransferase [Chloroflexi bacterium TSY]